MGLKGGVGKSMLACNLACQLAGDGHRVAVVDLDLQSGDVGVVLNLGRSPSISDLLANFDSIDADFIADVLPEGPGGVRVLAAPLTTEVADLITPAHVRVILDHLLALFDVVVVDTPTHLGEIALEVIGRSDRVILVASATIAAVKNTKLGLAVAQRLQVPSEHLLLALNDVDAETSLTRSAIETYLGTPVAVEVPHAAKLVNASMNTGKPFVLDDREAPISQRVGELARLAVPRPAPEARRGKAAMKLAEEATVY